ncbi:hypothetical protein JOM56_000505 [Amanita muscaria]
MFVFTNAGNMAVPFFKLPTAIVIWVELVMALLCPWNSDSKTVWGDLHGYQIDKACLCKNLNGSEHEFIVVDLSDEHKQNSMRLRVERAVGERKDSQATSDSSSTTSFESASSVSPSPSRSASPLYQPRFSKLSLSLSSVNEGLSRATGSLQRAVRRLSDTSLPRPSVISSNRHVAADTVTSINSFPKKARIIRTIDFTSAERSQRPSLWDLMIISHVVHQDSIAYDLLDRQCFWFADTISAILEKWSETCKGASVKQTNATRAYSFTNSYASSGSVKGFSIHQRNLGDVNKIWAQFLMQREEMNKKRQSYEDTKTEGTRKAEELAGQVEELRHQQTREKQKWELERKEWQEKEHWLMKEQEERERRLKQHIAEQERVQQRLQQQLCENDRRLQEIDQKFKLLGGSKN